MSERPLLPGEFGVLGLLAVRPMHGYEMARYFDRDDLRDVCPIEQSLLYTYIRNIEERGLITGTEERVGNRPPRKTYVLSEGGRLLVDLWLRQTVDRMREVRIVFLLKLYFLSQIDPAGERDLLRRQIDVCDAYQARLGARVAQTQGFPRLVAQSKHSAAEATSKWLRGYAWELEEGLLNPKVRG